MTDFKTIPEAIKFSVERFSDSPIITDSEGTISYAALGEIADRIASGLLLRGVKMNGRVFISMTASRWTWATFWAIWKVGAVPVAIGDLSCQMLADTLEQSKPDAHVFQAERFPKIQAAYQAIGLQDVPLFSDDECDGQVTNLRDLPASPPIWHPVEPENVSSIVFSSGTTGKPKGIVHTQRSLLEANRSTSSSFGLNPGDTALSVNQIYHVWSQVAVILTGTTTGSRTVLTSFSHPATISLLAKERACLMHAPPPILSALAANSIADFDLSSLRTIITGGAPANVSAIKKITAAHPQVNVRNGYGCSEFILATMDQPGSTPTPAGSSGAVIDRVDVKIVSPKDGVGQIAIKAASMMSEYLDAPEITAKSFSGDYFLTGDIGKLDQDGQLYVSGRLKDIVIVNGENVVPTEVENVVNAYPGVHKSAAYGVPHPSAGEAIKIKVVLEQDTEIEQTELLKFLQAQLSQNKVPRAIEFVDAFEETATGKIVR